MYRNTITPKQIKLACQHVQEMVATDVTENLSIRTLELFVDVYGKVRNGGSPSPHHVKVALWPVEARRLKKSNPNAKPKDHFRVEHGTPRRELARRVLKLYQKRQLTAETLSQLVKRHWKLDVITIGEDACLNRIARSKMYATPEKRWAAAKISFDVQPRWAWEEQRPAREQTAGSE